MNVRHAYQARHAAVHRAGPARITGTAVALALGAVPLAASAAQADTLTQAVSPQNITPLALENSVGQFGDTTLTSPVDSVFYKATHRSANEFTSELPVPALARQVMRQSGGDTEIAPDVLHQGAAGTLTQGLAPQAANAARGVISQVRPLVGRLRGGGVPTVGDLATRVGDTGLPNGTTLGEATDSLPVSSLVDKAPPVADTLANASLL